VGDRQQGRALWARAKSVTDAEYQDFYKQISYDSEPPLAYTHNRVEGRSEYTQLLYIPKKAPFDLWNRDKRGGVKLYVKRVFIMDDAEALMPAYLRFVKGVIDSADLPLNVSRELLQESRDVKAIREGSTKRVLGMLESLADSDSAEDKAKYADFWKEFGAVLKEGVGEDFANRERLSKLLRFASTHADEGVSLADYVARMKEGQEAIYVITADSLAAAKNSPQLEIFRKKGIEVLLLTDRVDEWLLSHLHEFEGTCCRAWPRAPWTWASCRTRKRRRRPRKWPRPSSRAGAPEGGPEGPRQGRARHHPPGRFTGLRGGGGGRHERPPGPPAQAGRPGRADAQPILEVNPEHALVKRLADDPRFDDLAQILFDQALLAEGGQLDDPAAMCSA
jgi:molecular chaperone HtpG